MHGGRKERKEEKDWWWHGSYKDISREGESEGIEWLDGKREEKKYRGEGGLRYKLKD